MNVMNTNKTVFDRIMVGSMRGMLQFAI
jgi:hypothetical protein